MTTPNWREKFDKLSKDIYLDNEGLVEDENGNDILPSAHIKNFIEQVEKEAEERKVREIRKVIHLCIEAITPSRSLLDIGSEHATPKDYRVAGEIRALQHILSLPVTESPDGEGSSITNQSKEE